MNTRPTDKVTCPSCGYGVSKVVDTRGPLRLRECARCHAVHLTGEGSLKVLPQGTRRIAAIDVARYGRQDDSRNI